MPQTKANKQATRRTLVLAERTLELVDRRGDFQALVENLPLALDAHVTRPLDETRQVGLVADVATDASIALGRPEEGILGRLGRLVGRGLLLAAVSSGRARHDNMWLGEFLAAAKKRRTKKTDKKKRGGALFELNFKKKKCF